jgi:hypothetical protein
MPTATIDENGTQTYQELKFAKSINYIIYKINDDMTSIGVECSGTYSSYADDFVAKFPEDDCRYAVVVVPNGDGSRIVFVAWHPDDASTKNKFAYGAAKVGITQALSGASFTQEANDREDLLELNK